MQAIFKMLGALALCAASAVAMASPAEPKNGVEYITLAEAQNTDAGKAIEVTEFFAYYCPHCNSFEPILAEWVKKQGANIAFKRVHIAHAPAVQPQQRLYFTLEALGLLPQYHTKAFAAIHEQHLRLGSDEQVLDWAVKAGIDRAKFSDAYKSFGVQAKQRRADSMMASYKINSWPMIAINGRYMTSPYQSGQGSSPDATEAQQQQWALQVMDFLVAKAKAEKK